MNNKLGSHMVDRLLEPLVPISYTSPGFRARAKTWSDPELSVDATGMVAVVTGANSGIGFATATELARRGATVVLGCRTPSKGREAERRIREEAGAGEPQFEPLDVADLTSVRRFADRVLARHPRVDALINNAGVLLDERETTRDGVERTFATNVLGGFAMTHHLAPGLARAGAARVVHVTSGGMYSARLSIEQLVAPPIPFDGVAAYAQTKRAQVVLSNGWDERGRAHGVRSICVDPAWVDTPGVERSLPRFYKLLGRWLRTPRQGADSVLWTSLSPDAARLGGEVVRDRRRRPKHIVPSTREKPVERQALWDLCLRATGLPEPRWEPAT